MIVLCFSMQWEDYFSVPMASVMCLHFGMQVGDTLERTNDKRHLCTF